MKTILFLVLAVALLLSGCASDKSNYSEEKTADSDKQVMATSEVTPMQLNEEAEVGFEAEESEYEIGEMI